MNQKHGFTLIELLAVIVVLAILALIATPIVMNTIKRSKKGAAERSADSYVKQVEVAVATERLNGNILEGEYDINSDGNLTKDGKTYIVEMNGTKPSSGKIKITNGTVDQSSSNMTIGDYDVIYNPTKKTYEAAEKGNSTMTTICELSEGTKETVGAKYTCHLDSDRTFYVLEINEDKVSLIMDRNFTDDIVPTTLAWCIGGGTDGSTCKNITSKEEGTSLKHIQDTFGTSVEVSVPSYEQIRGSYTGSMPTWLYGNINSGSATKGYWTSTLLGGHTDGAWNVYSNGTLDYEGVSIGYSYGIRPVITILKSNFS